MARVKIRRFDVGNGGATMKKGGEFVHVNDLELLFNDISRWVRYYERQVADKEKVERESGLKPCNLETYQGSLNMAETIMGELRDALGEDED